MSEPVRVGIGLIGRGDHYLIRRRPHAPGSPMPGYWEFPGGKCEEGESPSEAAARECREEIGRPVAIGPRRNVVTHRYPHGLVELHYFDGALEDPSHEPAPGSGFEWVHCRDLLSRRFPEANEPIVDELARGVKIVETR